MELHLQLLKMESELKNPVQYFIKHNHNPILLNNFLGSTITIAYQHKITCIHCQRETSKSFFQGFCYPCFVSLPQTEADVINPELCEAHNGVARDMEWAKQNCLIDHFVYLSLTSGLKVGVTRHTQVPTRWIDQGAEYAIKLAQTPYRQLAGLIEVTLKTYVKDKTNWRKMLTSNANNTIDLLDEKERLIEYLPSEYQYYIADDDAIQEIVYPVMVYPQKIKSLNLDKTDTFTGVLTGIKGQYLIFEDGTVFNVRKHGGYHVKLLITD